MDQLTEQQELEMWKYIYERIFIKKKNYICTAAYEWGKKYAIAQVAEDAAQDALSNEGIRLGGDGFHSYDDRPANASEAERERRLVFIAKQIAFFEKELSHE